MGNPNAGQKRPTTPIDAGQKRPTTTTAVLITADGTISELKKELVDEMRGPEGSLEPLRELLDCDYVEHVRLPYLPGLALWVDEEGRLKEDQTPNVIASLLFGTLIHGEAIVGHAVLLDEGLIE